MAYFLAVDAGGTKTDYALADEVREIARVRGGTIKRMRAGAEVTGQHLADALTQLADLSGVSLSAIRRTCIGTAGNTVPLVTDWLRQEFLQRVGGELILVGDVEIALDAAFAGGPGVLAMAGTGSNVAGRGSAGAIMTAGGWGPELADQGSGYRIGRESLRAAFLAKDEGRSTPLLEAVMKFWELRSLEHLIEYGNSRPAPDFSQLTKIVLQHAAEGDPISASVLKKEGEDLGYLVRLLVRRIQNGRCDETLPSLAFTGSVLENVSPVREALVTAVRSEFPEIRVLEGVVDPIDGALWRARIDRT